MVSGCMVEAHLFQPKALETSSAAPHRTSSARLWAGRSREGREAPASQITMYHVLGGPGQVALVNPLYPDP